MQGWRLIRDGFNDGFYNMAADEAVADAVEKRVSPPTLRFYGWKSPTLSIGYSQRLDKKVDIGYCRKNKIDIVQRPTGGRAMLHDKEVTYSLISPKDNPLFPDNISGTYKVISEALIRGLSFLEIGAVISKLPTGGTHPVDGSSQLPTSACFTTTSQYEITVDGKKLIGSAQRRFKNSFLQHGSMPLKSCHDSLALCLGLHEKKSRGRFIELLKERSIAINELNGRVFTYDEVVDAFIKGFEDIFKLVPKGSNQGTGFKIAPISEYELELAKKLCERKIIFP